MYPLPLMITAKTPLFSGSGGAQVSLIHAQRTLKTALA